MNTEKARQFRKIQEVSDIIFVLSCFAVLSSVLFLIWGPWQLASKIFCTSLFLAIVFNILGDAARTKAEENERTPFENLKNSLRR